MNRGTGFTLIEVLVALTITAVALAAGMKAAGALTGNAERLAMVTVAQWCAENQLTEMSLNHAFPDVGETEFECAQLDLTLKGKIVANSTPNPNFRRVDAILSDEQGLPVLTLSTIMGRF
ncbi:MAG TPA: type II secretion system minor pseudopilin GspI [Burkholderiaceae bacterium]